MKRPALPVAFILAFSSLAAISLAAANPFPTSPVISVTSPANKTYNVYSLILNVSIETRYDGYYFTSPRQVSYSLDGTANALATETDYRYSNETHSSTTQYTATMPDLAEGEHYLTVYAKYDYDVHVITSHAVINFTIDTVQNRQQRFQSFHHG
ncbi:hypothetical protein MUO71_03445 [Candidatus Bathyarchaeota archaeon]|nr:hypothetical protein [Candidatus Bathyarchaeota archaeon]